MQGRSFTAGMQLSPVLSLLCAASLAVATAAASPLVFTVLGDWGGQDDDPYTTRAESRIAAAMGEVAASISSQFTVALGDNFYDNGVKDVYDSRFKETFEVLQTLDNCTHRPRRRRTPPIRLLPPPPPRTCLPIAGRVHGTLPAAQVVCHSREP